MAAIFGFAALDVDQGCGPYDIGIDQVAAKGLKKLVSRDAHGFGAASEIGDPFSGGELAVGSLQCLSYSSKVVLGGQRFDMVSRAIIQMAVLRASRK